jgi:hypothetical protein
MLLLARKLKREKMAASFGGSEFAAHFGDAAEKMPMPGRCGHLLFAFAFTGYSAAGFICA